MSDPSKSRTENTRSWQQASKADDPQELRASRDPSVYNNTDAEGSEDDLVEQASKFLEHDEIKGASNERKIEFLKKKGLATERIHKLLGDSRDPSVEKTESRTSPQEDALGVQVEPQEISSSNTRPSPATSTSQSKDIPPIITYPEFLLHSQKPPPLITAQRLLTTFYALSGAAALTYGTSRYIIEPMVETLTSARHSLAVTAQGNLRNLNDKLEAVVSVLPDPSQSTQDSSADDPDELDASALYHRSAGTQTSPRVSRSNSTSSTSSVHGVSLVESQATKLQQIQEELQGLLRPSFGDHPQKGNMEEELNNLQTYLNHLTYGGVNTNETGQRKEDGIAKLKGEIRQAKGVLLSSRNFPSSVAARGWGTAAS